MIVRLSVIRGLNDKPYCTLLAFILNYYILPHTATSFW